VIRVVVGKDGDTSPITKPGQVQEESGTMINSGFLDGLDIHVATKKIMDHIVEKGWGTKVVNYKLRDWVFSRQRYWGEPIPLVYCDNCAKKKQKALIIHGFEGSGEGNWLPWVKSQLETQGFEVFTPTLSTAAHPTVASWMKELLPLVKEFGEDDIIIGHSLGSKAALHLLEHGKLKVKQVYLVASAIGEMLDRDWDLYRREWPGADVEALKKFWETPIDFQKISKHADVVRVILSDDDPWIKRKTHENLPAEWQFDLWHGYGHFSTKESPELLREFLKSKNHNPGWIPLSADQLPLELPKVEKYQPTDTGESPLAAMEEWVKTKCPKCGGGARRETDTMPNWAGSSWYFLRYCDPKNDKEFASMEKLKYWMGVPALRSSDPNRSVGVDWYNGGMEHTVLHLLYSRFWNQFLYDIGVVPTKEPYKKRTSHGLILASDGEKMSKSRGNVVNPDDMVKEYGADALRTYELFMGPFDQVVAWDTNGLVGVRRFLDRVWNLQEKVSKETGNSKLETRELTVLLHQTIKKVTEDIEAMRFNTAIAKLMELTNEMTKSYKLTAISYKLLIKLLSPFAPHMCEELWSLTGGEGGIAFATWPAYDPALIVSDTMTIAVQVNGKLRATLDVPSDESEENVKAKALELENVKKWFDEKGPKKVIYVKGKLVSVVV
ncbi:MAG: class I tRNA ligase family protein, partial [Patescibacteria group bacterium]